MTGLEKQVNDKWAMDLVAEIPPIVVNKRIVSTDMCVLCHYLTWLSSYRLPVMVEAAPWATLRSTLTWKTGNLWPVSTVKPDTSSSLDPGGTNIHSYVF